MNNNKVKTIYMAALATIIWLALAIQFYISVTTFVANGRSLGGAIVHVWSYFTIQNNFLIALALAVLLLKPTSKAGQFFAKPQVLTAMAVYIIIVGAVYQLVLRQQYDRQGWLALCSEVFHSVCPIAFIIFWLFFIVKPKLPWYLGFKWLVYPLIYCFYILARGAYTGYYPYSFINGNKLSNGQLFINCLAFLFVFVAIGLIMIAIARRQFKNRHYANSK